MNLLGATMFYWKWYYSDALVSFFRNWITAFWFVGAWFSTKNLIFKFFAPWQRIKERRKQGLDLNDIFEVFMVNIIMRFVAMFLRIVFLVLNIVAWLLVLVGGIGVFVLWVGAPLWVIYLVWLLIN